VDGRIPNLLEPTFTLIQWHFSEEQVKAFALPSCMCFGLELIESGRTSVDAWSRAGKKPATDFGVLAQVPLRRTHRSRLNITQGML
jgi:hypothetical protein